MFQQTLVANGYPDKFIRKHMKIMMCSETYDVPKKPIYIQLQFKGDTLTELLRARLIRALNRSYYSAKLKANFISFPLVNTCNKGKLPRLANSVCIYEFTCSCQATCIDRKLSIRIKEHLPSWFCKG